jgi:hypothetical protein
MLLTAALATLLATTSHAAVASAATTRTATPASRASSPVLAQRRPIASDLEVATRDLPEAPPHDAVSNQGRVWSPFPFPYWGPQGYIIGPPWFGAGFGGGNWRPIPNRTPFGPPGSFATHLITDGFCDDPSTLRSRVETAEPFEPVLACEGFPCEVYTCRLGTNTTDRSTLAYHRDETGETFATLRCFKLLDDFDETGCREWDRLELNRERTDKRYECAVPTLEHDRDPETTPTWENTIEDRRSRLECVAPASIPEQV